MKLQQQKDLHKEVSTNIPDLPPDNCLTSAFCVVVGGKVGRGVASGVLCCIQRAICFVLSLACIHSTEMVAGGTLEEREEVGRCANK